MPTNQPVPTAKLAGITWRAKQCALKYREAHPKQHRTECEYPGEAGELCEPKQQANADGPKMSSSSHRLSGIGAIKSGPEQAQPATSRDGK